jgi:hypothetical protein
LHPLCEGAARSRGSSWLPGACIAVCLHPGYVRGPLGLISLFRPAVLVADSYKCLRNQCNHLPKSSSVLSSSPAASQSDSNEKIGRRPSGSLLAVHPWILASKWILPFAMNLPLSGHAIWFCLRRFVCSHETRTFRSQGTHMSLLLWCPSKYPSHSLREKWRAKRPIVW